MCKEVAPEIIAYGACFEVVVCLGELVVIVAIDHIEHTRLGGAVKVQRYIIGGKTKLGALLKGYAVTLIVLRVHRHIACDDVIEQPHREVLGAVIDKHKIGVYVHLVENVGVIHQFWVSSR